MNWNQLTTDTELEQLIAASHKTPQVIFKHSTRCSISSVAYQRLQKAKMPEGIQFHFLDLLAYRPLSNKVAQQFKVHHESPQILLIKGGECVFDESHLAISMNDIAEQALVG